MEEMAYKVSLFGNSDVGKTTLVRRYLTGYFEENIKITMGAEVLVKFLIIQNIRVVLQIWDFGGEENFKFLLPLYSKGSSGGVFMFDLTRNKTLDRIEEWIQNFKEGLCTGKTDVPILLVGGKSDLLTESRIPQNNINEIIEKYNFINYIECSSKTGEGVEKIFEALVIEILKTNNII